MTNAAMDRRIRRVMRLMTLVGVTLAILLLPACRDASSADAPRATGETAAEVAVAMPAEHDHSAVPAAAPGELPGHSIYHLESDWWDQTGATRSLASLGGQVQVLSMVYTHCSYSCPLTIADMKRIDESLGPALRERVGFVLVSIDPERDTPERLARFTSEAGLTPDRWTALSADEDELLELAAVLGVRYARESETEFSHTNLIVVLSPEGEVVHRQLGLGDGVDETVARIRELAAGS